jgi:hypothetical protein
MKMDNDRDRTETKGMKKIGDRDRTGTRVMNRNIDRDRREKEEDGQGQER